MTEECKGCAILRRYEKTARERGYAMGKAAGDSELARMQDLLTFERKAHAETNAALTAEITRLETQLASPVAAPTQEPVAYVVDSDATESVINHPLPVGTGVYAAPTQGEPQGAGK